jgi:hypothetical protein
MEPTRHTTLRLNLAQPARDWNGCTSDAGTDWWAVEVIGVTSGRLPSVDRLEGSRAVFLTFDGLRDAKVRDRNTRIRIALRGGQVVRLWRCVAIG